MLFLLTSVVPGIGSLTWMPITGILSMLAYLFLAVLVLIRRRGPLLAAATGLLAVVKILSAFVGGNPYSLLFAITPLVMCILLLPKDTRPLERLWAIAPAAMAIVVFIGMFDLGLARSISNLNCCLEVWAWFILGAWLAKPTLTLRDVARTAFTSMYDIDSDTAGGILGTLFVKGVLVVGPIMMVLGAVVIVQNGGLNSPVSPPFLLIMGPAVGGLGYIFLGLKEGYSATKTMKRSINEVNARSNILGVSDRARAELKKEAAKAARKEVIKSAVVGGVIAGDAGAVVGAMAAKAKQDGGSAKGVVKGAVIGGVIGGDAGAIVGATAAKAGQDAGKKADK